MWGYVMIKIISSYLKETGQTSMATLLKSRTYTTLLNKIKAYVSNMTLCRRDAFFGNKIIDNYNPINNLLSLSVCAVVIYYMYTFLCSWLL